MTEQRKQIYLSIADRYFEEYQTKDNTAYYAKRFIKFYKEHYILLSQYYIYFPNNHFWKDRIMKRGDRRIPKDNFQKNDVKYPHKQGLYLIGQTIFNPITDEKYYWVKVGWSSDLASRRAQYNTHTSMIWDIGYLTTKDIMLEYKYHDKLFDIALHRHADEWFSVPRENYLQICQKGFEYFKED